MVIVNIQGGLGNQLFQYAAGLSLAQRLKTNLYVDDSWYSLNKDVPRILQLSCFFNIEKVTPSDLKRIKPDSSTYIQKIRNKLSLSKPMYFCDYESTYNPDFEKLKGSVYLEGNFQSYKYHVHLGNSFFSAFNSYKSNVLFEQWRSKLLQGVFISVHLRRGDYVNDAKTNNIHGTPTKQYYTTAIAKMQELFPDASFLFFSDDKIYAQREFSEFKNVIFLDEEGLTDVDELILMANCKHHIIANSSFSWWGAYLTQDPSSITIFPNKWFNLAPKGFDERNLIPSTWQKIG